MVGILADLNAALRHRQDYLRPGRQLTPHGFMRRAATSRSGPFCSLTPTRADSPDALETIRADPHQFSAVITDHTMPVLQGAELSEMIGDIRTDLPVILMTGLNQPPEFANSRYASRRSVIHKPINFIDLSHRLRSFLD